MAYWCFFMLSYLPSQSALMHTELQACETRKRLTGICDLINLVQTTPMSNGQSTKALRLTYGYRERSPSFGLKESREGESLSSEVGCCPSEAISNCPTADARTINRLVTNGPAWKASPRCRHKMFHCKALWSLLQLIGCCPRTQPRLSRPFSSTEVT